MDKTTVEEAIRILQDPASTLDEHKLVANFLISKKKEVGRMYWAKWRKDNLAGISLKTLASCVSTVKTERVYRYSCQIVNPEDALRFEQQMRLKYYHYNSLVSIARHSREEFRRVSVEELGDDLLRKEEEKSKLLDEVRIRKDEINQCKIIARSKKVPQDIQRPYQEQRDRLKALNSEISELKKSASKQGVFAERVKAIHSERESFVKKERSEYSRNMGLYWANYLESEEAIRKSDSSKTDPCFKRWSDEGHTSVQLQGGLSVRDLYRCADFRLRMKEMPEPDTEKISAKGNRYILRGKNRLQYRLESFSNGSPFFIDLDVKVHRPLPETGIIKWAHLRRRKAPHGLGKYAKSLTKSYDYFLDLVLEEPTTDKKSNQPIGVHLGWQSQYGSKIVIMTTFDGITGKSYYLGENWFKGWEKAESIQREIDRLANETSAIVRQEDLDAYDKAKAEVEQIDEAKASRMKTKPSASQIIVEQEDLNKKRRRNVIKTLLRMYRNAPTVAKVRPSGPAEVLKTWRSRHLHLSRYYYGMIRSLRNQRDDLYHCWVKELQNRGGICAVYDMDLSEIAEDKPTEEGLPQEARRRRQMVALSRLRNWLFNKLSVQSFSRKDEIKLCFNCGFALSEWNGQKTQTCEHCGTPLTNATNQARHLYKKACESLRGDLVTSTSRS